MSDTNEDTIPGFNRPHLLEHVGGCIGVSALFRDDEGMVYMLGASAPVGTDPAKLVEVIEAQIKVWPRALEDVD